MDLEKALGRLKENYGEDVRRVQRMIQQPSISGEGRGIRECAELVAEYLQAAGCENAELVETEGHPVVCGDLESDADRTLIVYMMYDTQPFAGEAWSQPPLDANVVPLDPFPRVVVGRGAINTKGPLVSFLNAITAAKAVEEPLPVNLTFVCEGEEELGSPHLPKFFEENLSRLRDAEAVLYPTAMQDRNGNVRLRLGNKGIVYLELVCSGAHWGRGPKAHGIHSSHKAWVDSPAWRMVKALGTLVSDDGNTVAVEGFYDEVLGPTPEEHEILETLAADFDPDVVREADEVDRFIDDLEGRALLERYMYSSTLNIDGIWGGHTGPGTKTVLPHEVRARVDIRLVPNQAPDAIIAAVRNHLDKHGFPDIAIDVHDRYDWSQTRADSRIARATVEAYRAMGHEPQVWPRIGGSLPMYLFTKDPLRLPAIAAGLGYGAHAHAPDEFMVLEGAGRVAGLLEQELSYLHVLDAFGRTEA